MLLPIAIPVHGDIIPIRAPAGEILHDVELMPPFFVSCRCYSISGRRAAVGHGPHPRPEAGSFRNLQASLEVSIALCPLVIGAQIPRGVRRLRSGRVVVWKPSFFS